MRSGNHALWEAEVVRGYARARITAAAVHTADLHRAMAAVVRGFGRAVADAEKQMAKIGRVLGEQQTRNEVAIHRAAKRAAIASRAACPQNASIKERQ